MMRGLRKQANIAASHNSSRASTTMRPAQGLAGIARTTAANKVRTSEYLSARCYRAPENNILLCPGMNAAAVHTGELLCLHCRRLPAAFVDCPSSIGEFRGGRTPDKQAFDVKTSLCFCPSRRIKKESCRHLRADQRFAVWPCRTVT